MTSRQHPALKCELAEAATHMRLFVGKGSAWSAAGLPWRVYAGGASVVRREICGLTALKLLQDGEEVSFRRMRVITIVPDMHTLEK